MGANKTNPNRKKHGSSKTGIMFPSNPAACGRENPSKQNLGGKFLLHYVFFMCIPKFGEDVSPIFFIWVIHPHPAFRHETHPTTSQVLPQAQLSDFSCPALIAVLCANWNACHTKMDMWMKFMHCIFSLMLIISTCGTVCLDFDLGAHKSLYTSF